MNKEIEGEVSSLSCLLSVFSSEAGIVARSGCPVSFIQTIDKSHKFSHAVQYPQQTDSLKLETLMHIKSYSVFGWIDFFSVMKQLLVSHGGSLEEAWTIALPVFDLQNLPVVCSELLVNLKYVTEYLTATAPRHECERVN